MNHTGDGVPGRWLLAGLSAVALVGALLVLAVAHPIPAPPVVSAPLVPRSPAPGAPSRRLVLTAPWATPRLRRYDAAAVADILNDVGPRFPAWTAAAGVTTWQAMGDPAPTVVAPALAGLPANGRVLGLAAAVAAAAPGFTHAGTRPLSPAQATRAATVASAWALADAGNQLAAPFARLDGTATYAGMLDADSFVGAWVHSLTHPGLGSLVNHSYTYRAWVTWPATPTALRVGQADPQLAFPPTQTVDDLVRATLVVHAVLANRVAGAPTVIGVTDPEVLVLAEITNAAGTHWLVVIASSPGWQPTGVTYYPRPAG